MAVGNVVGSNIFNIGMVLGLSAIVFGDGIPAPREAIAVDMPIMVATAVALLPIALAGFSINRWEGVVFVALLAAYMAFVTLFATQHAALTGFTTAMQWFVLPLLGVSWLAVVLYLVARKRRRRQKTSP